MTQFSQHQQEEIKKRGISVQEVEQQMQNFKKGFPFLSIKDAATPVNGGIKVLQEKDIEKALDIAAKSKLSVLKFVPASGAASRMFKDLFQALDNLEKNEPVNAAAQKFFDNLRKFPFMSNKELLKFVLFPNALNYGATPKGLVQFHKYAKDGVEKVRTAFEEHLVEGALYSKDSNGKVKIMFTVSPEHQKEFETLYNNVKQEYERTYNCHYEVSFTQQEPSTDIIAADDNNEPFITSSGNLLFRPGGHGALLNNLNVANADIIVVKNIDNVVKEELLLETVKWKQILIGKSIELSSKCNNLIKNIEGQPFTENLKHQALEFLKEEFSIDYSNVNISDPNIKDWILSKLNRPIRVCGMVKNEGEPGGGPYIINEKDGSTSLQILEAAQIDKSNKDSLTKMQKSTHFNPVDLVCSVKNYKGEKFDLKQFTNPETGFISEKSYEGRVLKAQELPGLWNGSMSNWNTQFVEVPLITFNPVKTVIDLLRPEHN